MTKRKKISLLLAFSFLFTIIFSMSASAEEMFDGYHIRWSVKASNNLYYQIKMNGDLLTSDSVYKNNISTAASNWSASPTKGYVTVASFTTSNVDLATPSQSWWDSHVNDVGTAAITAITYNGKQIFKASDLGNSRNVQISYANIYINPFTAYAVSSNESKQTNILMHELGHVYGMGHTPTNNNTLMFNYATTITQLTSYDISVMSSFYGAL